ncbi:MAG: class I SAM-dependent methyltransferase [Acidobacteriota bacterium]
MKKFFQILLIVTTLSFLAGVVPLIVKAQVYQPHVGQGGKDVIWVPTPDEQTKAMLDLAEVSAADYVIDLGSGDGRIVIAAAERGATALGIEYNPDMVELSREKAEKAGVSDRATFIKADLFEFDFSKASVITMYLLPDLNLKLRPKLLYLEPGTRIVSHAFNMDKWEADRVITSGGRSLYLWIIPAKVDGTWTWTENSKTATLDLDQTFQMLEGSITFEGNTMPAMNMQLRGDRIAFTCGNQYYSGRVTPSGIQGTIQLQDKNLDWIATRKLQAEK